MSKHDRQSFLGAQSENILRGLRIAIVGLGGGGSHIVQQLAHIGVGHLFLYDFDCVEDTNLNRLVGATEEDAKMKRKKVEVATRVVKGIDSKIVVATFDAQWQTEAETLRTCDVIFGCVDSFIGRKELETAARRYLTPYIDIGMDVHHLGDSFVIGGQVFLSMPGRPCMRCFGLLSDELVAQEAARYGAAGARPQVIWPNGVLASLAIGIFMNLVTPWSGRHNPPLLLEYDGNNQTVGQSLKLKLLSGVECPHFLVARELGDPFLQ